VDREITIRDYLNVAWSGRWLILVTTVLGIIVGILVSVAHVTSYSSAARVSLGQPTSVQGTPLQTPLTNAQTAPGALDLTALSNTVAHTLGVPLSDVLGHVHAALASGEITTGSAPPVLVLTASSKHPAMAVTIANAFARAVVGQTGAQYNMAERAWAAQVATAQAQVRALSAQVAALHGSAATSDGGTLQLLTIAGTNLTNAQLGLTKAQATEQPRVLVQAYTAASSNTAPKRLESVVLAGLVGLLLGLIATFIWRGSPAARAASPGGSTDPPTNTTPRAPRS
jgi:uncharacterized protein involved in exopolysaccharide biosynthesis